jgi:hypothetical protein
MIRINMSMIGYRKIEAILLRYDLWPMISNGISFEMAGKYVLIKRKKKGAKAPASALFGGCGDGQGFDNLVAV